MQEEILPGFFRIVAPLPGNPLKELNAWLVRGKGRHLLIDNGFNMAACEKALREALAALEIETRDLDFFITHLHSDHNGLTHKLVSRGAAVFAGRIDGRMINEFIQDPGLWAKSLVGLARHGFEDVGELVRKHPGKVYACEEPLDFSVVEEGDELEYGEYVFTVAATPGHTPGHLVLHEKKRRFLVSGDHILGSITPNITCWPGVEDSLGDYLASLRKTARMGAQACYPGHRAIVEDTAGRIRELLAHHEGRLAEAAGIVHGLGGATACQVAERMRWNLRGSWREYHVTQKCFAVGEAVAHLDHLAAAGIIAKQDPGNDIIIYS